MARLPQMPTLDKVDCSIIRLLQERGRESFSDIGKSVGLSSQSVGERVRRLEQSGIIGGYHAAISTEAVGFGITAFILARPVGADARFAKHAAKRSEILECHRVTGDVSFLNRAVVRDVHHLENLLEHLEPITSYVLTLLVLSTAFDRNVTVEPFAPSGH
jgi:Lrp/AsnC family transcriptional regulator, leucine-responsive regulatory protein